MTLTFGLKRSSTKSKRTHKKFPRYKFKDFTAIPRNLKEWGYCKHNWNDDDYTYLNGDIEKFLNSLNTGIENEADYRDYYDPLVNVFIPKYSQIISLSDSRVPPSARMSAEQIKGLIDR